jgi:hypothetical protein
MKEELLQRIEGLGDKLPPNTLDQLIDELGGPENVAEASVTSGFLILIVDVIFASELSVLMSLIVVIRAWAGWWGIIVRKVFCSSDRAYCPWRASSLLFSM